MLTFYFPGLAVAVFSHIQATAILHSGRLYIKGAYVERELQVSCGSTSKQRSKFRNRLHNVLYTRVQSDCLTKLRVGTLLRLNFFFFNATKNLAHPSVCEEQRAPGTGWNTCTASRRTHKRSSQFLQTRKHTVKPLLYSSKTARVSGDKMKLCQIN